MFSACVSYLLFFNVTLATSVSIRSKLPTQIVLYHSGTLQEMSKADFPVEEAQCGSILAFSLRLSPGTHIVISGLYQSEVQK